MAEYEASIQRWESATRRGRQQLDSVNGEVASLEARLAVAKRSLAEWQEAQRVLQECAALVQGEVHGQIAGVVTRCLKAVFGEGALTFHVEFDRKRGKAEARLFFKDGENEIDPMEQAGLSAVDVASFALRLACLKLMRPEPAQVLCLDEPYKWLSPTNRRKLAELMLVLSEEMGVQILCVSHDQELKIGNVIEV